MIITIMNAMPNMETSGIALSSHPDLPLKYLLNTSPAPIGITTILIISHIMTSAFTSMNWPPKNFIHKGVINGDNKVATAVRVMDKAKFALARYDITFDAIPQGMLPINTTPAATSGGKLNNDASIKPINGINVK